MDVYGLIGNPVGHSLSPAMHEAAYEALDLDAQYVTFEPSPEELDVALAGAEALGVDGLNVTIPFKEAVFEYVDADDLASRIGAINTIDFTGDHPTGHNTDIDGVKRSFAHHDVTVAGQDAVIVGAGGAARAVAFALADSNASVTVTNRTEQRAHRLAEALPGATGHGLDELDELVPQADLLINATSVGMEEDISPVPAELLHSDLTVFDAVYRPLQTRLLQDAAAAGAQTIDGAWMLLYQGIAAFELWTEEDAPVEAMNQALRARLKDD